MLRIWRLELLKGCAGYTVRIPEVKGKDANSAVFGV
jgi:hypothetical protein